MAVIHKVRIKFLAFDTVDSSNNIQSCMVKLKKALCLIFQDTRSDFRYKDTDNSGI